MFSRLIKGAYSRWVQNLGQLKTTPFIYCRGRERFVGIGF
jgi:hypothetical protein